MIGGAPWDLQAALSWGAGFALAALLLALLLDRARAFDRVLFTGCAMLPILIYLHWRITQTLPSFDIAFEPLWARFFLVFETISIAYTLGAAMIMTRCSAERVRARADAAEALLEARGDWPAVDIFICTYNEKLEVLEKAIVSALALDYPPDRFTVWVLDDTRRAWLRDYCDEVGARYLTRPDNKGAKAGNLNSGYRQTAAMTKAPLILVLDADFAPQRQMLKRMVGLFLDPKVGVVQTPQFYFNPDPIQHNLGIAGSWVDDQRVFFDLFQPAKDAWGCAFCVGTGFIVRRDLLDLMGGFPEGAVSEDIYLTYSLLRRGFETRWLNERLSIGLSAEDMAEYCTQRARWCLGTIQVALLRDGPFFGRGYTLGQRLHYLHGMLHWLSKPFLLLLLIGPAIYWVFGVPAFQADHVDFVTYGVPALACFWVHSAWISGGRSLPLFTEVSHAVAALPVTMSLVAAALRPFGRPFKVTAKGRSRTAMTFNRGFAIGFGGILAANLGGIAWSLMGPDNPVEVAAEDVMNIVWASIAIVLALVCLLVSCELPRPRGEERFDVFWRLPGMVVEDCSVSGARLRLVDPARTPAIGTMLDLVLPEVGAVRAEVVRLGAPGIVGIAWRVDPVVRRRIIALLFSRAPDNVARAGRLGVALGGLWRRVRDPDGQKAIRRGS
ncbi:glycosyltransferase [Falsiroseomonas sp.]|uniref:glycosyltransferase n=1 Tax=Falsiroseomonas sp. TaxID=2870721 RepID=UPI003F6F0512